MSDPALLQLEGSQPKSAVHFVPLSMQKFFSGLWTQRSPFNGPDNRYNTRFLGGRPEILTDGLNVELTNYGTVIRRPGLSLYSTAVLSSAGEAFYSFHDLTGAIRLMVDTVTNVSVLTPNTNTNIFSKSIGSGQTDFLGVGNTLYFGDGIDLQAYQPGVSLTSTRNWGISIGGFSSTLSNYAGLAQNVSSGLWTNPTNAQGAPNNTYATYSLVTPANSQNITGLLKLTTYGFSVPAPNTVSGIQITLTGFVDQNPTNDINFQVSLSSGGGTIGNQVQIKLPVSSGTVIIGSPTSLFGTTLTPAIVNDPSFGIIIYGYRNNTSSNPETIKYSIDSAQIQVFNVGSPAASLVAGALTTTNGGYSYVVAYGNSASGHISNPTNPTGYTGNFSNKNIQLPLVASSDPQVNQIRVYRTKDGGSVYFELPTSPYPNTTQTITDSAADSTLQLLVFWPSIPTVSNTPPPAGLLRYVYHLGRVWGAAGNFVYYSAGPDIVLGNGNEAWPPANFFLFPSTVTHLVPISSGLLVFTTDDTYIILGTSIATFYAMPFQLGLGVIGANSLDIQGSNIFMWTSDRQFIQMSSAGINEIGFAIGDLLQSQLDPNTDVHVASLISGTSDKAVFIGDAVGNWYRCNWNQPPEGGPAWSPKASIVGGFTHFQVVETAPGLHQLLVSQNTGNGSIVLFRDLNVFADNGQSYNAFLTFGSIVLAQSGQLAEVVSVTTELQNRGTQPSVSVRLEEISGPFETLSVSVPDPPGLTPSNSVLSRRFYLNQSQQTVDCRHLQIRLDFAAEAVKNELLTLSIFGALKYKE